MASPRTRKPGARLRRKEGGDVGAVLQQLGNPVARPLVPKAASPPLRGRTTGNKDFPYTNRENGWRCRLKGRCPSAAPKDWRSAWNQADPNGGPAAHFNRCRCAAPAHASVCLGESRVGRRWWGARRLAAPPPPQPTHPPPPPTRPNSKRRKPRATLAALLQKPHQIRRATLCGAYGALEFRHRASMTFALDLVQILHHLKGRTR